MQDPKPTRQLPTGLFFSLSAVAVILGMAGCNAASPSVSSPPGPAPGVAAAERQRVSAVEEDDRVRIMVGGALFTEYKYPVDQKYPYFYPVIGPRSGLSVTTESSEPWPHHRSLFFGSDHVNGGNYWQDGLERGQIVPEETRVEEGDGDAVVLTQTTLWSRPGAEPPIRDRRRIRITAPSHDLRFIDFDVTLTPLVDVRIEQTNHSLFAARMSPDLAVNAGGTLVNAQGGSGEEGTFAKPSSWADYWGVRNGMVEGLAIFNHPQNRWSPPPWFTRNYGFFSPTPFNWIEDGQLDLPAGQDLRLRYRVVVHGGDTSDAAIVQLYREYAAQAR
jgi:hypothetical protein